MINIKNHIWQSDKMTRTSDANLNIPHKDNRMLAMSCVDNEYDVYLKLF